MKLKVLLVSAIFIALTGTAFAGANGSIKGGINTKQFVKSLNSKYPPPLSILIKKQKREHLKQPIHGSTAGYKPRKEVWNE